MVSSINFDMIDKWIIVYDTTKGRKYKHIFENNPKILELECADPGISGNAQRNHGMKFIKTRMYYILDDDNIIHPSFWDILKNVSPGYFYTFDQLRNHKTGSILKGDRCKYGCIDTAQFIMDTEISKGLNWVPSEYGADGIFIETIFNRNTTLHKYIPTVACYYNYLT